MENLILKQFINSSFLNGGFLLQVNPTATEQSSWMSVLTNPIAIIMILIMFALLFVIRALTKVLLEVAGNKMKRNLQDNKEGILKAIALLIVMITASSTGFAQDAAAAAVTTASPKIIGGMAQSVFYVITAVIIIEAIIIYVLLMSIRKMVTKDNLDQYNAGPESQGVIAKWWDQLNGYKAAEQADIDLGHDYDGIRELDNRLPPWWLYGFYATILFSGYYLWTHHVSHSAPDSIQEYKTEMAVAEKQVAEYLKTKGDDFNENTVKMLGTEDIAEGKKMFETTCAACHLNTGAGSVGPNLTDAYWLNGGDIKSVFKTIKYGIRAMPPWQNSFSGKQMAQLASFVESLKNTNVAGGKAPEGEEFKEGAGEAQPPADSTAATAAQK